MPEGDSIHWLATKLRRAIQGQTVRGYGARTAHGDAGLVGRRVVAVDAHGKNLFVRFDDGRALHIHLRMLGRVSIEAPGVVRAREALRGPSRCDLRLEVDGAVVLGRRIPVLRLIRADEARREVAELGPDLLAADFDEAGAIGRLRALGQRPIGEAIMIQRAVAGIGNVYKSELLFLERIHPEMPIAAVDDDALGLLLRRARELMRHNVRYGPRRTRSSLAGPRLWVYGRRGEPCPRCQGPIEAIRQAARTTYFCPRCQVQSPSRCPAPRPSSTRSAPSSPGSRSRRSETAPSSARSTSRSR